MFEKLSQVAEQVAMTASRRQFLGRFGRGALALAATVAGAIALPSLSKAGPRVCGNDSQFACIGVEVGTPCPLGGGEIGKCRHVQGSTGCLCVPQGGNSGGR